MSGSPWAAARKALRGELPERYAESWDGHLRRLSADLRRKTGVAVLDIGGGRHPTLWHRDLAPGATITGLDLLPDELAAAPEGAYDATVVADAAVHQPELDDRFDLVVSSWLLEHVRDTEAVLRNVQSYLAPGGRFVALVSGGRSPVAAGKRLLPEALAQRLIVASGQGRDAEDVFPAVYDRCTKSGLEEIFRAQGWGGWFIAPLFRGATYLSAIRPLQAAYVGFEEALLSREDHATAFLVVAQDGL